MCRACEVVIFFEQYLYLTGDYAGEPFRLMPWTRQVVRDVFGTLDGEGLRQYKDVYTEVPTGNSKTTFCAGLVLYFLCCHRAMGTEIYSAATAKDQASITFRMAQQMVEQSPEVFKVLRPIPSTKRIIRRDDPTSFYSAISGDGDVHDGMNPLFVVRDELHRWRTRKQLELNEVLERKIVKRKNPLIWDITTAGEVDESPICWRRHEYTLECRSKYNPTGVFDDPRFYGRIWAADAKRISEEGDYWKSREARVAANPSHEDNGGFIKDSVLLDLCVKAQNDPQKRADYLRYHLNVWGQKDDRAVDMEKWIASGGDVDLRTWPEYDYELLVRKWGLINRPCFAGVDASWTTDLTSLALLFPPLDDAEVWTVLSFFWMPEDRITERERKDKVPYSEWVRLKFIETCAGNAHDYEGIRQRVLWAAQLFDLREMAYDPANFRPMAMQIEGEGIEATEITQRYAQLNEATKWLLGAYLDRQFRHGNNPVLNWNARCLCLRHGTQGDVMPDKPDRLKMSKRIDGISAIVTAANRARLMLDTAVGVRSVA